MGSIFENVVFLSAAVGWLVAQILKTLIHMFFTKKFVAERLVGSGGMPSSHSATVCALTTAACIQFGAHSFEFAISLILALIVMYDAMGVRRETGIQAKLINEMMDAFAEMGKDNLSPDEKLKEFVGHTPLQVLAGAILGILIALLICGLFEL
ncbi:MAG: divergent PAP2 family protein [Lachnospiraceae bacterium]|nr:divergent PAP2 family protein [Lachnospiraceae bacterium]